MKTLTDKLKTLSVARRKKVEKRAASLIAEEMTMRELRRAKRTTQVELAKSLGVKQEQVSRIEGRTDLHISTLRRSIEALGGRLSIVAEFPDGPPIVLKGLGEEQ
ncbi:MAG: helix-turn-helix transcriptional regulator [Acidobacteriota bacterium]|nr:helix-turn-helix transcriptional regulator [Acidobacteriota bacterium]